MSMIKLGASIAFALLFSSIPSCGRTSLEGPPSIMLGDSTCQECGMIISDERFATSTIIVSERGDQPLLFDDFNCQIIFEHKMPELEVVNRWSHDYASSRWIETNTGWFVHSMQIRSPMASGLAFFETRSEAESYAETLSAVVLNHESAWLLME
jgi:nitrous oxide reductase accessory protein NosL